MIAFELNKPLNHFFETALTYIDEEFRSCGQYLLEGDCLIALGYGHSIQISYADRGLYTVEGCEQREQCILPELPLYEEETMEAELMKYVYTVFRRWQQIPPYASAHMHKVLLGKLNKKLMYYDLRIQESSEMFEILYSGNRVSLEDALGVIIQRNAGEHEKLVIRTDYEEAERLRGLGHHEDALPLYLRALEKEKKGSSIYTLASYGLGEVYYFMNDMEKTVRAYLSCDVKLLSDANELYRRLGHAFLDERLKNYTDDLKAYFKSIQSVPYANRHKEETAEAFQNVGEIFEEYEETCMEVGKKQYDTFKK